MEEKNEIFKQIRAHLDILFIQDANIKKAFGENSQFFFQGGKEQLEKLKQSEFGNKTNELREVIETITDAINKEKIKAKEDKKDLDFKNWYGIFYPPQQKEDKTKYVFDQLINNYKKYINNENVNDVLDGFEAINQFASYCDTYSRKQFSPYTSIGDGNNFYQRSEEKRCIAAANYNNTVWIDNILRYLENYHEDKNDPKKSDTHFKGVTLGVQRAIEYFNKPEEKFPILSENHRASIEKCFDAKKTEVQNQSGDHFQEDFDQKLKKLFDNELLVKGLNARSEITDKDGQTQVYYKININGKEETIHQSNLTYIYTVLIYKMKSEWDVFDTSFYTNNKNVILTGAPGTGKTYLAKKIAEKITGSDERMGFVQFHPSYDYADFVEGLRPKEYNGQVTFELVKGTFKTFCEKALVDWIAWMVKKLENLNNDDESKKKDASKEDLSIWLSRWKEYKTAITDYADFPKYVFIIDEINRGEMSKIFGELFFSIDPGYRGTDGMVSTQYANMVKTHNLFDLVLNNGKMGQFFVPENVYIIGTMNDIDRSVESMDFAFRRRFAFKEIYATDDMIRTLDYNAKTIIRLIGTMERVNKAIISEEVGLTEAYQLGGSYFLKIKNYYEENSKTQKEEQLEQALKKLWDFHLRGTLYEYFRGEPDADEKLKIIEDAYTNNG